MPINESTTTVYVRVDLASRRIVSLSGDVLSAEADKPVFAVAANDPSINHYIVEDDVNDANGITVRLASPSECETIDQETTNRVTAATATAKYVKSFDLKTFYDEQFIRRFRAHGFMTTTETLAAWQYSGTDPDGVMAAKKAEAEGINNMYNEWRFGTCQTAIDDMFAADDMGVDIDEDLRSAVNDTLDNFLAARGIDIGVFHR